MSVDNPQTTPKATRIISMDRFDGMDMTAYVEMKLKSNQVLVVERVFCTLPEQPENKVKRCLWLFDRCTRGSMTQMTNGFLHG